MVAPIASASNPRMFIEQAAGRERLSVNTWLVRVLAAALAQDGRPPQRGGRIGQAYTGWAQ
jgi:hypothetical protein